MSILTACAAGGVAEPVRAQDTGVVYEIFVPSFADSDGDGTGDLKGIEGRLDYLVRLGVSDVWLTPLHPSPSYHHYDVTDYLTIDPAFGTMDDLQSLIDQCHARRMKLYLDLVINHTSVLHPWVTEHPGWYADKNFFGDHMPELDLDNEQVREEITKITDFYLDMGIDGFRLDAALHYFEGNHEANTAFLTWLNTKVKEKKPDAYLVAEVWTDFAFVKDYYASGIDSFFDFDLSDATGDIARAVKEEKGAWLAERMAAHMTAITEVSVSGIDAVFLSNHDQGRSAGYYLTPEAKRLAAAVLIFSPGKPYLYYGEELGLRGSGRDENKRPAMPWGDGTECLSPAESDYTAQIADTVVSEEADEASLLQTYRALLAQRASYPWLAKPALQVSAYDAGDDALFCLHVTGKEPDEDLYILHNFSGKDLTWTHPSTGEVISIGAHGSMIVEG